MRGSRILIVEDEGLVAMELASRIEAMGYTVAAIVNTGEAAIEAATTQHIDLALVDVRLKGKLSGTEAVMRVREVCDLAVVFLTAYSDDETLERIKRCEPRGYLLKPFDERTLWVTVETALYAHEMAKERAAAEQARRRSEALHAAVLRQSPDAIISPDLAPPITGWNEGAVRMFGYAPDELLGQPLDIIIPSRVAIEHRRYVAEFARSERTSRRMGENLEISARRKSGEHFPADISISKLELDGESVLTAFVRDVSERRAMEGQIEQTKRLDSLGRLAGGVAHDFNNLLVGVFGYARLLKQSFEREDPRLKDVEEIEHAARRAAELVRELLAYGRQQVLKPEHTEANTLLQRLESLLGVLAGRGCRLRLRLDAQAPAIVVDPLKLEQVIINLVVNARDAMPQGGVVAVETRLAEATEAHDVGLDSRCLAISVTDTGIGMDAETLQHIYEPFFTTKSAEGGTGLGLSTVHGIVHQSGGKIRVFSVPGKGTRFDVYFPAVPVELARESDVERASEKHTPGPRDGERIVLLVDDEPVIRELAARVLRNGGYTVLVAADGQEASEIVADGAQRLDLLLTDVVMPSLNGYELADLAVSSRPGLCVALMSGFNTEARRPGDAADADYPLIEKPFAPDTLLRRVTDLIASCRASSAGL